MGLIKHLKFLYRHKDSKTLIKFLRKRGITIGEGCVFRDPKTAIIDRTRPCLITIGNNVDMNRYFTIMTHDYVTSVFIHKYGEFINSSGRVTIGDNVYFGMNCTVLKGVTIGENCIIGANSLVPKDIPANSVAIGTPAKVVCTIEEFFERRKKAAMEEAFDYARCIKERLGRMPVIEDFKEEFGLFVSGGEEENYPSLPISRQLQEKYPDWCTNHTAPFKSFADFLKAAGL